MVPCSTLKIAGSAVRPHPHPPAEISPNGPLSTPKRTFAKLRYPLLISSMLTFDEVIALVASKPKPLLVAIDGLPLSGKTTLALRSSRNLALNAWAWTIS